MALKDGVPYAGCVLQNWMPASVEMHHAMPRPIVLRHGWMEVLANAGFGEERLCVYSLVSAGRHKSLKFHKHIGFRETGRVPNGDGPGVDLVVLSIERHEFKYWKESRHGWSKPT